MVTILKLTVWFVFQARKLEEHRRKCERKKIEKELSKTRERIKKMKENQHPYMNMFNDLMEDPEMAALFQVRGREGSRSRGNMLKPFPFPFQDQEVTKAFLDAATKGPEGVMEHLKNPKVLTALQKLAKSDRMPEDVRRMASALFTGGQQPFGEPDAGQRKEDFATPPKAAADVDLD